LAALSSPLSAMFKVRSSSFPSRPVVAFVVVLTATEALKVTSSLKRTVKPRWASPEALVAGQLTPASDIWSFAVVMWEVLTLGEEPYSAVADQQIVLEVPGLSFIPSSPDLLRVISSSSCFRAHVIDPLRDASCSTATHPTAGAASARALLVPRPGGPARLHRAETSLPVCAC
jgi:hypothetical protein